MVLTRISPKKDNTNLTPRQLPSCLPSEICMKGRAIMLKVFVLLICCFIAFTATACQNGENAADQTDQETNGSANVNDQAAAAETTLFFKEDFTLKIDTLPYRGAVLFIDYSGEQNLADYQLSVDILLNDTLMQENMPVEEVEGKLTATIIDLMYLPGDELDFILTIKEESDEIYKYNHSEKLQRYPWKDWMLAEDEWFTINFDNPNYPNFVYDYPDHPNMSGSHSSWDYWTTPGKSVEVFSGTKGLVYSTSPKDNLEIYNPYVGAIVQYGHTNFLEENFEDLIIMPGDHVTNVIASDEHIHYSIYRPYRYSKTFSIGRTLQSDKWRDRWEGYYWPVPYDNHGLYDDPFYWHEPTTLGYWYEETLPPGLKEEMIAMFQKHNPGLVLPVMKPSGGKLTYLEVTPGNLSPNFTEGGSDYAIAVDHNTNSIDIRTILSDTDATMEINGQPARSESTVTVSLNEAGTSTEIAILITAVDGENTRSYDLTVNRAPAP